MDRGRAEVYQGLSHITVVDSCFFDKFRKLLHAWISNYFFLFFFFPPFFLVIVLFLFPLNIFLRSTI